MTLVVARAGGWGVRVASDIRVTDREAVRNGYTAGVLKSILIDRGLCLSFAGEPVPAALDAVRSERNSAQSEVLSVERRLLARHRELDGRVDFLVAALGPPRLSKVSGGELHGPLESAWIGDHEAFTAYQGHFHGTPRPSLSPEHEPWREELETAARMAAAMECIVDDETVPSVGETAIHVIPESSGFRYSTTARMVRGFVPQSIPSGIPTTVQFGNATQGGFGYAVLVPDEPGIGTVGLHFYQGRLGVFYEPLRSDSPEAYPKVSHDEFREAVLRRRGIAIQGTLIS